MPQENLNIMDGAQGAAARPKIYTLTNNEDIKFNDEVSHAIN
jgi:hypothetical protein